MFKMSRMVVWTSGLIIGLNSADAQESIQWRAPAPNEATVQTNRPPAPAGSTFNPSEIGLVTRSTALAGKSVKDQDAHNIGRMEDLLVDLSAGRVLACLVSTGGKDVMLVPASSFFPVSEDRIVFTGDKHALKSAQPLPLGTAQTTFEASILKGAFQHFGKTPPDFGPNLAPVLASSLIGKAVLSQDNKPVGQVGDLAVNIPKGQAVYVVLKPRPNGELYAVPPQAFDTKQGTTLVLKATRDSFLAGPRMPDNFWTEMEMPSFASAVYQHYRIPSISAGTSPAVAGSPDLPLTATGRSDQEIRDQFLSEIVNSATMPAVRSKQLQVTVSQGVITLSGTAPSQSARQELIQAAQKVAGPSRVVDTLTVR